MRVSTYKQLPQEQRGYVQFVARETCIARDELYMSWLINNGAKSFINIPTAHIYEYYFEHGPAMKTLKHLALWMERNWTKHITAYPLKKRTIIQSAKNLSLASRTDDRSTIQKAYKHYMRALYNFGEYIWSAWALIYHIEPEVILQCPDTLDRIMSLERPIEFLAMKQALFRLPPDQIIKRYGWLNMYNPFNTPYSVEEVIKLKQETSKREIEEHVRRFSITRRTFRRLLASIPDNSLRKKVQMVHAYAFLKTDRIDAWRQVMAGARGFFEYLAGRKKGLTLNETCNMFSGEILDALTSSVFPPIEQLRLRSAHRAAYYLHNNTVDIVYDQRLIRETTKKLQESLSNDKTLKGIVACKGQARGRVVVIAHSDDLKKVRQGDIFVAKYTFPSFTPFMLKCGAIVTDEGGITGHAAIVSREYNKSCIIATQMATRILHDGDMVDVDANRGIITVLKKYSKYGYS